MAAPKQRVTTSLRISSRLKRFQRAGVQAAYDLAFELAEDAQRYARENVEQGVGPGPHDGSADKWGHLTPHEDTGDLRDSIYINVDRQGFLGIAQVYTDSEYGAWLEIGWHAHTSTSTKAHDTNFFRYPWLKPAFERVIRESASDLSDRLYRKLSEKGTANASAVDEVDLRKWIHDEELIHFGYTEE